MLTLDKDNFYAVVDGKNIPLTKREWEILSYLAENEHRVVSKQQLLDIIWDDPVFENTVEVYVKYIRTKIGPQYITTRRGFGYKINLSGETA